MAASAPWTLVCFSGVDWDYNRQRPQWVMSTMAERGADVLYVDNLGLRFPRPSDARRVARRVARWFGTTVRSSPEVRPRIRRDAPIVPPFHRIRFLRRLSAAVLARRLRRRVGRRRPLVVWTYLPTPVVAEAARALEADLLVYDWSDDAAEHLLFGSPARRRRVAGWEEDMLRRADLVFVASGELLRRRGSPNPRTFVIPHGAPDAPSRPMKVAGELEGVPKPRVGFVGTVSEWVDLGLLEAVARARPAWSLVLVGPQRARANGLRGLPNVTFVGPRAHERVGGFLEGFDVALIPYRVVPATHVASPVKLAEYLAHGLPVVSTDLPEVRPFAPPVQIASDPKEFVAAIERALGEGRTPRRPGTPWARRVDEMIARVEEALAGRA
jgi:glycosyltransferase involved in cell wall biosynthesis